MFDYKTEPTNQKFHNTHFTSVLRWFCITIWQHMFGLSLCVSLWVNAKIASRAWVAHKRASNEMITIDLRIYDYEIFELFSTLWMYSFHHHHHSMLNKMNYDGDLVKKNKRKPEKSQPMLSHIENYVCMMFPSVISCCFFLSRIFFWLTEFNSGHNIFTNEPRKNFSFDNCDRGDDSNMALP